MSCVVDQTIEGMMSLIKPRFKVLAYHAVRDVGLSRYDVFPDAFEKQMNYLASHNYNVVSLKEACERMSNNTIQAKSVVLTFDDGFKILEKFAFPILKRYGFPATVFLPVTFIGEADRFSREKSKEERSLLGWDDIQRSMTNNIYYGSHTMSHPDLTTLDDQQLMYELLESKEILKKHLQLRFIALAYPFGSSDERVKKAARNSGYDCAVAFDNVLSNSHNSDSFALKREAILHTTTQDKYRQQVDTSFDLLRGIKTIFNLA